MPAEIMRTPGLHGERADNFVGLEEALSGKRQKPRMRQSADGKSVVEQIRDVLKLYLTTVTQLFRDWDDDKSGTVSKEEFRRALPVLGLSVEREDADALFDTFDADGSGELDLDELSKHLRAGAGVEIEEVLQAGAVDFDTTRTQRYALRKGLSEMQSKMFGKPIDIDPDSDVPVIEQLQEALGDGKVLGRVVDIFREWDEDGSGEVSKREFAKAMSILGVDRSTLDELFDLIDVDGSGHIDYKEIYRKLRKKVAFVSRKARAARAAAMNEADAAVSYDDVRVAAADALDAKQELIRLQRQLMLFERKEAAKRHRSQKRAEVAAIRADLDRRVGRDLVAKLAESDIPIATAGEVTALSKMMNDALKMVGDADGCHAWYQLFRAIDDDGSGRISYAELASAVRQTLELKRTVLPERRLLSLWRALDDDNSGFIDTGEFGRFMKRGEVVRAPPQLKVHEENRAAARAEKAMLAELTGQDLKEKLTKKGVEPASDDEMLYISGLLNRVLVRIAESPSPEWYRLFKEMDTDGSGLISYDELHSLVRNKLKVPKASLSDRKLQACWLRLDSNASGSIDAGEFGRFMKGHMRTSKKGRVTVGAAPSAASESGGSAHSKDASPTNKKGRKASEELRQLFDENGDPLEHMRAWKPGAKNWDDGVDPDHLEALALRGEVRRAEAEAMRLREEAKRLQEQLKRKAQMAGEELPAVGLTRSQSSNVGGSGQLPTRAGLVRSTTAADGSPSAQSKVSSVNRRKLRKPHPSILRAYGLGGTMAVNPAHERHRALIAEARRARSEATLEAIGLM